jgi:hypothetical protein
VDQLDQALESKVKDVEKYLASRDFNFTEQTTMEELAAVLKEDQDVSKKTEHDGPALYRYVMSFAGSMNYTEVLRDSSMKRLRISDEKRRSNNEECKMI